MANDKVMTPQELTDAQADNKVMTPQELTNAQAEMKKKWSSKGYKKAHGMPSPEAKARWEETFPNYPYPVTE